MKIRQGATSSRGRVAAGSPHAARAGAQVLAAGGNAVDAAIAACLALCVADPINASLAGRVQMLGAAPDGSVFAVDGASVAPSRMPTTLDPRRGACAAVPLPGLPRALAAAHRAHGRAGLETIVAPAHALAAEGFVVPPHLGAVFEEKGALIARDAVARRLFGGDAGALPRAGDRLRQPVLAQTLARAAREGLDWFLADRTTREGLAARIRAGGGFASAADLARDDTREGEVLRLAFGGRQVVTIGRQGWGHTLAEMLAILEAGAWAPHDARFAEALALTILCAFQDRPQVVGTLAPKPFGLAYERLVDPAFVAERAAAVERLLARPVDGAGLAAAFGPPPPVVERDTTHLSVVDADGGMVALTASIGPHFGAGVADPVLGCLMAHSYRMAARPMPGARDVTEMTPTLVLRDGVPEIAIGAAGSERIPAAIVQVLVALRLGGASLAEAVAAPRLGWSGGVVRLHRDYDEAATARFMDRGYELSRVGRDPSRHLGIVQAVMRAPDGATSGAADPSYDGAVHPA